MEPNMTHGITPRTCDTPAQEMIAEQINAAEQQMRVWR
jgi:hypothetical protein